MHECPNCGQACDCCGDDLWNDLEAADCTHECEESELDDDGFQDGFIDEYGQEYD